MFNNNVNSSNINDQKWNLFQVLNDLKEGNRLMYENQFHDRPNFIFREPFNNPNKLLYRKSFTDDMEEALSHLKNNYTQVSSLEVYFTKPDKINPDQINDEYSKINMICTLICGFNMSNNYKNNSELRPDLKGIEQINAIDKLNLSNTQINNFKYFRSILDIFTSLEHKKEIFILMLYTIINNPETEKIFNIRLFYILRDIIPKDQNELFFTIFMSLINNFNEQQCKELTFIISCFGEIIRKMVIEKEKSPIIDIMNQLIKLDADKLTLIKLDADKLTSIHQASMMFYCILYNKDDIASNPKDYSFNPKDYSFPEYIENPMDILNLLINCDNETLKKMGEYYGKQPCGNKYTTQNWDSIFTELKKGALEKFENNNSIFNNENSSAASRSGSNFHYENSNQWGSHDYQKK